MGISEIAKELQMTEGTVRVHISRALRKLMQAGEAENFAAVVRLTQAKKTGQRYTHIRCGSIECRPEKQIFYYAGR